MLAVKHVGDALYAPSFAQLIRKSLYTYSRKIGENLIKNLCGPTVNEWCT
jgi:hypothetical protein